MLVLSINAWYITYEERFGNMITKDKNTKMNVFPAALWSLPLAIIVWVMVAPYIAIPLFCLSIALLTNFDSDSFMKDSPPPQQGKQPLQTKTQSSSRTTTKSTSRSKPKKVQKKAVQTKAKAKSVKATSKNVSAGNLFAWPELGEFNFEIGEDGRFQDALTKLANGPAKAKKIVTANLIPEDDNPEDDRSVRIDINDMTVGYMRRDNARSFRRRLSAKQLKDQTTACQAIVASTSGQGAQTAYNVLLDLKPFV